MKPGPTSAVGFLDVAGCPVRYAISGAGPATVLLVHGAGAHRLWWHRMVPELAERFRVVTLDLSGHGDSGRRESYGPRVHALEVRAAARTLGRGPVIVVGHSMGGRASLIAASHHSEDVAGLVLLDTMLLPPGARAERVDVGRPRATYPDIEHARASFRLIPAQPLPPPEVVHPIVDYGLAEATDGWTWKFDPRALGPLEDAYVHARLGEVTVPLTYVYGTNSVVPSASAARLVQRSLPGSRVVAVEHGHHHLPLDSPQACLAVIRSGVSDVLADG